MNDYELMLIVVGVAAAVAWAFFKRLARLVVWSSRPKLDLIRYSAITLCISTEIGETFEWWEAALLVSISVLAYSLVTSQRACFESAMQQVATRGRIRSSERSNDSSIGS